MWPLVKDVLKTAIDYYLGCILLWKQCKTNTIQFSSTVIANIYAFFQKTEFKNVSENFVLLNQLSSQFFLLE